MSPVRYRCSKCNHAVPSDIQQIYCPHCHGLLKRKRIKVAGDGKQRIALIQKRNQFHGRQKGRVTIAVTPSSIGGRKRTKRTRKNSQSFAASPKTVSFHSGDGSFSPEVANKKKWPVRRRRV